MSKQYRLQAQIPEWNDNIKTACFNCHKLTNLSVNSPKGKLFLCSTSCQENFSLKAGIRGYNTVRDHDKPKLTTVGNLQDLTAIELQRMLEFKQGYNRSTMNKLKGGDSLDHILYTIDTRLKKKSKVTKVG